MPPWILVPPPAFHVLIASVMDLDTRQPIPVALRYTSLQTKFKGIQKMRSSVWDLSAR
jgi:hypothetical protein